MGWWQELSDAQATLLAALVTVVGAGLAVLLGGRVFGGKVTDLKSAVEDSGKTIEVHLRSLDAAIDQITEGVKTLDSTNAAFGQKLASLEGGRSEPPEPSIAVAVAGDVVDIDGTKSAFLLAWEEVRGIFESIANNPALDGRTRASYLRVDRRSYDDLITKMASGREPSLTNVDAAREAVRLRNRFRTGRAKPIQADVDTMRAFVGQLKNEPLAQDPLGRT
jgi:hypothetical protein